MAGVMAVALTAPPSLFFVKDTTHRHAPHLGFANDHISLALVGGGSWATPGLGWVHSEELEALKGHVYGDLKIDNFEFSDLGSGRYQTVRAGYLVHPWASVLGGATLGYRRSGGDNLQNAVEVGLPLFAGSQNAWVRLEPIYLFSSAGVTWNYRFQCEIPISRTPFFAGFNWEARTVRQGGVYFGTMALVFGIRS
jgi:hypothetical protein